MHEPLPIEEAYLEEEEEEEETHIVRVKRFPMTPMMPEEAVEQMELLGHDFFVFYNPDDGRTNVLYRRKSGDYGLLQPELD
jgi:putative sigma-54 modulation protein